MGSWEWLLQMLLAGFSCKEPPMTHTRQKKTRLVISTVKMKVTGVSMMPRYGRYKLNTTGTQILHMKMKFTIRCNMNLLPVSKYQHHNKITIIV